ncbi:MAG: sulfatase [Bacteroidota bacterium]
MSSSFRNFFFVLALLCSCQTEEQDQKAETPPNIILIFCDDLGYGDLGVYGSTKHRTPNIDQMAAEGLRLTDFYVTSSVCTPSRSSLMTGCYPRRVNMHQNARPPAGTEGWMVLFPVAQRGLHPDEISLAEVLKQKEYKTACIGKWHMGDQPQFLPTRQGFDSYFGIPYSNDMGTEQFPINPPLPLMRNESVIEAPAEQSTLTKRYTEEAIRFIQENQAHPFFLYLPHTFPHDPLFASEDFLGKSQNGVYGDAVEELDWSTGEIMKCLKKLGIDENTLVIFSSDNGASSRFGGSNLPLSDWKGGLGEGGFRVPCILRWPGHIPAGETSSMLFTSMDLMPSLAFLAGAELPRDRIIDGMNLGPHLRNPHIRMAGRETFFYYRVEQLQAIRHGQWKLYLARDDWRKIMWNSDRGSSSYRLYDLSADIAEENNLADQHPEIVAQIASLAERIQSDIGDTDKDGANQRPAGHEPEPKPLVMNRKSE